MIIPAIQAIRSALSESGTSADLGNIGEILSGGGSNNGSNAEVIISLVNIEEDRVSRDPQNFRRTDTGIILKNPAIHLNLTLLFTAVRQEGGYELALQSVQRVIEFFQNRSVFNHVNTPDLDNGIEKLIIEMLSFNLEQLQQLWSMLGGKYHPSVAYRVRMVTIDSVSNEQGRLITDIESIFHLKRDFT